VLPYFRKLEHIDSFENEFHGKGGPLGVGLPRALLPISEAYFAAAAQIGIPRNRGFTGVAQDGVGYYHLTRRNYRRSSTSTAFLHPARRRKNLTVKTGAQVLRLVVEQGRAVGVEPGGLGIFRAATEVILSCGAIGSRRHLQLSGIGPAEHLTSLGIPVVYDQPGVGANLQDHLDLFVIAECTGPHTYDRYAKLPWQAVAVLQYAFRRRGPMASSQIETGGFWHADPDARSPDIQFHLGLGSGIESGVAAMPKGGVTLNSAYLRPRSRGTVRLSSADPLAALLIDPNSWADPYDREMSIRGLKLAQEIMRQPALKPYVLAERLPGPGVVTDQDYFEYACSNAKTDHHPVGTCRMGADAAAVVDPAFWFNGIASLRVIDASIMPNVVSSNTNAATIMIAENAADMIRAAHGTSCIADFAHQIQNAGTLPHAGQSADPAPANGHL